jgi:hypothetical protein
MILQLKDIHKTPEKEISTTRKISLTRIERRNLHHNQENPEQAKQRKESPQAQLTER